MGKQWREYVIRLDSHMRVNSDLKKDLQLEKLKLGLSSVSDVIVLMKMQLDYLSRHYPAEYETACSEVKLPTISKTGGIVQ